MSEWETKSGGQLAALISRTEERGGPTPVNYPNSRAYWCAAAEFWYFKANGGAESAKTDEYRTDD